MFLNGINPGDYDDVLKTMKAIERQSKNIKVRGGALYAGSSRVDTFFKNMLGTRSKVGTTTMPIS